MSELDLTESTAARQIAENKLAATRATVEAMALEKTRTLLESPQPVVVPWSEYPGYDDFSRASGAFRRPYIWADPDDRTEGRYRPYYETEQDLRAARARCRELYANNPVANGLVEALTNYTLGNGFEFQVKPRPGKEKDQGALALLSVLQPIVDRLIERNDFVGVLDRQIHAESRIVGESFPTVYPDDKDVRIELVDPSCFLQPAQPEPIERMLRGSHKLNYWWHGVHTQHSLVLKRDDVSRPLGYHAIFDQPHVGGNWDYLPVGRVQHVKRNVGPGARRGVSDFHVIETPLNSEQKIRVNTAEGAAILAAIVMIRQHADGVPRSSVERIVSEGATDSFQKPSAAGSTSVTGYSQKTPPGTVKDMPFGMQAMLGPLGTLRSPVYIEVAQYLNRISGLPRSTPEYLISGDPSNGNFASTLVAEGPFVKARENDQGFDAAHFEALIWKGVAMYYRLGWIRGVSWEMINELVEVKAEYASPASRDRLQQVQVNQVLNAAGIMSKKTWASDMQLDLDEEKANEAEGQPNDAAGAAIAGAQQQLNGAQITAAADILGNVSNGTLLPVAGVGLLVGVGIDRPTAQQMVDAAAGIAADVQAKKAAEDEARFSAMQGAGQPPVFESMSPRVRALARSALRAISGREITNDR